MRDRNLSLWPEINNDGVYNTGMSGAVAEKSKVSFSLIKNVPRSISALGHNC